MMNDMAGKAQPVAAVKVNSSAKAVVRKKSIVKKP